MKKSIAILTLLTGINIALNAQTNVPYGFKGMSVYTDIHSEAAGKPLLAPADSGKLEFLKHYLLEALKKGTLKACEGKYNAAGKGTLLTYAKLEKAIAQADPSITADNLEDRIASLKFIEDWTCDATTKLFAKEVKAVQFNSDLVNPNGQYMGTQALFYVLFK